ncbi:MAG: MBL fold metallo-hydrolase [bacterium]
MRNDLILKNFICGQLATNCYIFGAPSLHEKDIKEIVIIDPAGNSSEIINYIDANELVPKMILITHGHIDHVADIYPIKDHYAIDVAIHKADALYLDNPDPFIQQIMGGDYYPVTPDRFLDDNDTIEIGTSTIQVIHTPGHTPGGICLLVDSLLFTGDTLFAAGIGRTDFPGGDYGALKNSITTKLWPLPDDLTILPGHGPKSKLGMEKKRAFW